MSPTTWSMRAGGRREELAVTTEADEMREAQHFLGLAQVRARIG